VEFALHLKRPAFGHLGQDIEEEVGIADELLGDSDRVEVHEQVTKSQTTHQGLLGLELFWLALLEQIDLALALEPLIEEVVEVEVRGRLRRLGGALIR